MQDAQHQVVMANPLLSHAKQYNSLLVRAFPSLTKINGEYLSTISEPKPVSENRHVTDVSPQHRSASFLKLHSIIKSLQAYRSFNTKQLFQKILITFAGTTPLMKLQKSTLPFTLAERLLKTSLESKPPGFRVLNDELFYKNLVEVYALKSSCRSITNYVVSKRVRQRALLNRMEKKVPTMIKLQSVIRGHLCRVRNK